MLVEEKGVISRKKYKVLEYDEQVKYWQIGRNKFKLIAELDNEHLQNSFCFAQTRELIHHNKYMLFYELVCEMEEEAERRGLSLSDINTEYHKKIRRAKSKVSTVEQPVGERTSDKV